MVVLSGGRVGIKDRVSIKGEAKPAETKACHRSMLVLDRVAVLEAQIDQRRACSWPLPFIKSFEWQIMKII